MKERQQITSIKAHSKRLELDHYSSNVPEGQMKCRLDHHAWGKSTNLFCYFTNLDNDEKYRLSVFHRSKYRPYDSGPEFDKEAIGTCFLITVKTSKKGSPTFINASAI